MRIKRKGNSLRSEFPRTNYTTSKPMKIFFFVCLSMSIRLITPLLVLALFLQLGLGCLQLTVIPQRQRVSSWCRSGGWYVVASLLDTTVNTIQSSVSLCICRCKYRPTKGPNWITAAVRLYWISVSLNKFSRSSYQIQSSSLAIKSCLFCAKIGVRRLKIQPL
jgi:hypothetical protein